jgi:antitoxin ParD1/3/4
MNVSLTPELEKFVAKEVESGSYQTASEVIRAGLRRLMKDQQVRLTLLPDNLNELESQLHDAVQHLDQGRGVSGNSAMSRIRKKIKAARNNG